MTDTNRGDWPEQECPRRECAGRVQYAMVKRRGRLAIKNLATLRCTAGHTLTFDEQTRLRRQWRRAAELRAKARNCAISKLAPLPIWLTKED